MPLSPGVAVDSGGGGREPEGHGAAANHHCFAPGVRVCPQKSVHAGTTAQLLSHQKTGNEKHWQITEASDTANGGVNWYTHFGKYFCLTY